MNKLYLSLLQVTLLLFTLGNVPLAADTIGVRTLAVEDPSELPERYFKTRKGYELLTAMVRLPSEMIYTQVDGNLPLYEKITATGEQPEYQVVEELKIPEGAKSLLILYLGKSAENNFWVIEDNFPDATYNKWLLINTTQRPIILRVGKDEIPFRLSANESKACTVDLPAGQGAAVKARSKWDDKVKTFYSTYWSVRENERTIAVFIETGNRIRVRKISDTIPGEK